MKGKRYKKKEKKSKKKSRKVLGKLFFLFFISMMIFSGIKIYEWINENKQVQEIINDISSKINIDESIDNVNKYNVNFEELKQTNSDIVGWIKVNGTNIEYPVVQANNNEYYLTHSFDKSYNSAGWVFMDYRNKINEKNKNTIIYAHNRRDGSLFATLKNILNDDWKSNEENFVIPFITEKEKSEYKVFSVYKIENEDYYISTDFETDEVFKEFINKIKARSEKDFNIDVTINDEILTLSTCANDNRYRVVLHAKKL